MDPESPPAFFSPFAGYLNTNYVPSTIDRAQILSILAGPEAEVAHLTDEIAHLQAELDGLQTQHDALQSAIAAHYQLLSPFRRLPDDILREVFQHTLPEKHNALMSAAEAPLLLGRVCSRWRALAFSTPRLWATLHIPLPVPPTQSGMPYAVPTEVYTQLCRDFEGRFRVYCRAIHDWLVRSGSCALSISLHPVDVGSPGSSSRGGHAEYVRAYFDIILRFAHRWRSLELSVPAGGDSSLALCALPASAVPQLEFLHLKFSRRAAHDPAWTRCGLFSARGLRALQLTQFPFRLSALAVGEVDLGRLTCLVLADPTGGTRHRRFSLDEAGKVFARCRSLVHCVLDVVDNSDAVHLGVGLGLTGSTPDVLALPHLESLTLIDSALGLSTLLERLSLPSLHTLSYHTTFWPSPTRRSPLLTLLSCTSGDVRSLTTDVQFFTLADLVECFELVPQLRHLCVRKSRLGVSREQSRQRNAFFFPMRLRIGRTVLELFVPHMVRTPMGGEEERCLCPRLQVLEVRDLMVLPDSDVLPFLQRKMELAARSRSSAPSTDTPFPPPPLRVDPLKEVTLTFTQEQSVDLPGALRAYTHPDPDTDNERGGLKLTLKYPDPKRVTPGNFSPSNGLVKREPGSDIF